METKYNARMRNGRKDGTIIEVFRDPDSPKVHAKGRECQALLSRCATAEQLVESGQEAQRGKLSVFATKIGGVLLCEMCRRKCVRDDLEPKYLAGKAKKKPPKKEGVFLPRLGEVREAKGIGRQELADDAGCAVKTLYAISSERTRASMNLALRLAEALGVDLSELVAGESEAA